MDYSSGPVTTGLPGVMDDAHVSLFIVADNPAEIEEDWMLWVGCNVTDA